MTRFLIAARQYLRAPSLSTLARDEQIMNAARTLVSSYYFILPFLAYLVFLIANPLSQNYDPIWPLWWSSHYALGYTVSEDIVHGFFLVSALLGLYLYRFRLGRILVFIGIWQMHALYSSFGQLDHQWLGWLYTSFILIFLPDIWEKKKQHFENNRIFLLVVWWAQASVMLIYTMSGVGKFVGVFHQLWIGQISGFSMMGFAYQIADWLPRIQTQTLFGGFIINHPIFGWPLYVAMHFIFIFSIWTMVRPSLQRLWGLDIVLFHVLSYAFLGITFTLMIPLAIVLFFNSPFGRNVTMKQMFFDLPVVGQIAEWYVAKKAAD